MDDDEYSNFSDPTTQEYPVTAFREVVILALWFILPELCAQGCLSIWYFLRGQKPPLKGTPQAIQNYARMYTLIISLYLIYNVIHVWIDLRSESLHLLLNIVPPHPNVDSSTWLALVRTQYRQLARVMHPDRNPHPQATAQFVRLRDAFELLQNKPEIYRWLGPEIARTCGLQGQSDPCTLRNSLEAAMHQRVYPMYLSWGLFLGVLSMVPSVGKSTYWYAEE
jgi:hypothetical protein